MGKNDIEPFVLGDGYYKDLDDEPKKVGVKIRGRPSEVAQLLGAMNTPIDRGPQDAPKKATPRDSKEAVAGGVVINNTVGHERGSRFWRNTRFLGVVAFVGGVLYGCNAGGSSIGDAVIKGRPGVTHFTPEMPSPTSPPNPVPTVTTTQPPRFETTTQTATKKSTATVTQEPTTETVTTTPPTKTITTTQPPKTETITQTTTLSPAPPSGDPTDVIRWGALNTIDPDKPKNGELG